MDKSPVNQSRGYSTNYEDHVGLLHKLAKRGYAWLEAAHSHLDYEDVYQEMCVGFVKAVEKWNPERGITFSAYMGTAAWNNFIKVAKKRIDEKVGLNVVSYDSLDEDEDGSFAEDVLLADSDAEHVLDALIRKQEARLRIRHLSDNARAIIKELISPSAELVEAHEGLLEHYALAHQMGLSVGYRVHNAPSVTFIGRFLNIPKPRVEKIRDELHRVFGVKTR